LFTSSDLGLGLVILVLVLVVVLRIWSCLRQCYYCPRPQTEKKGISVDLLILSVSPSVCLSVCLSLLLSFPSIPQKLSANLTNAEPPLPCGVTDHGFRRSKCQARVAMRENWCAWVALRECPSSWSANRTRRVWHFTNDRVVAAKKASRRRETTPTCGEMDARATAYVRWRSLQTLQHGV